MIKMRATQKKTGVESKEITKINKMLLEQQLLQQRQQEQQTQLLYNFPNIHYHQHLMQQQQQQQQKQFNVPVATETKDRKKKVIRPQNSKFVRQRKSSIFHFSVVPSVASGASLKKVSAPGALSGISTSRVSTFSKNNSIPALSIEGSAVDSVSHSPALSSRKVAWGRKAKISSDSSSSESHTSMPPVGDEIKPEVEKLIKDNSILVFSKTTCPFCTKAKDLLKSLNVKFETVELDQIEKGPKYQAALADLTGQKTVPSIFILGQHLGGCDDILSAHSGGKLTDMIQGKIPIVKYDYDLAVIGGGSGGLAASKEAAALGKKVTLFDFVKPSPVGTTWGLGGTCVNVGCIPKKLMHRASILGESLGDARAFGWQVPEQVTHNWETMRNAIQDHIGSLNWGYRVQLRDKKVQYVNAYAEMIDNHTIKATKKNKQEVTVTAETILIATGERPRYLDIPGKEFFITSDDLFSLPYCPGKTLCVGASYVSLECAGFLAGIGLDTTVMVRSILLRGFDQQCAEIIGKYMQEHAHVKFIRGAIPTKVEEIMPRNRKTSSWWCKPKCQFWRVIPTHIEKLEDGQPGRYRVTAKTTDGQEVVDEYNTILLAIGRDPCTANIGLENVNVQLHEKTNRVLVDENECTNVSNVYAIGDIGEGRPELTPVAIQAGKLLSQRLFKRNFDTKVDYNNIATTVFTPLEYGCIGYSEEAAIEKFGEENIEVYHSYYMPLEWTVPHRPENTCYAKLICLIPENEKVIGFHVLGPDAGEITQGYALAMRKGVTKEDFDATIGIHPTCSETFTTLHVTKRSGATAEVTGC